MTSRPFFTCVFLSLFAIPALATEERVDIEEHTLDFAPGNTLAVHARDGGIIIKTWENSQVHVQAVKSVKAKKKEKLEELLKGTTIEIKEKDSGIEIRTNRTDGWTLYKDWDISVSYTLTVPTHARLNLETVNGSIAIPPITGNIMGKTEKGSIQVSGVSGQVHVETKKNGDITLTEIMGSINASTSDGNIEIKMVEQSQNAIQAKVHKGQLTLSLPPDFECQVQLKHDKGHIDTEFPILVKGRIEKSLSGTINGGNGPKIQLEADNGEIKIKKL